MKIKTKLIFFTILILIVAFFGLVYALEDKIVYAMDEKENNNQIIDENYSSQKIIDLQIVKQDGFESYINLDIQRINETRFLVSYNLNDSLKQDIKDLKKYLKTIDNVQKKYDKILDKNSFLNSINNEEFYSLNSLTSNIKLDKNEINLSNDGFFYVDLQDYDKNNLSKSIGQQFKIGYNTVIIQTVESTNDVGQYSSIALDSNGIVHISEYDATNYALRYCNNSGGIWSCMFVDGGAYGNRTGQYSRIAIDSNNKIHIVSYSDGPTAIKYCNNTLGPWSCAFVGTNGNQADLAIDSNNKVHIIEGYDSDQYILYCNNTLGSFVCSNILNKTSLHSNPSIAIDSNNKVHISIINQSSNSLMYCNNTLGTWGCVNISNDVDYNTGVSIAIDSNNKIHIICGRKSSYALMYCNNTLGTWGCVNLTLSGVRIINPSIVIGLNNTIYVNGWYYSLSPKGLIFCNNSNGIFGCNNIINNVIDVYYKSLAIKLGRIVDSFNFSSAVHGVYYNNSDLFYWNQSINNDSCTPSWVNTSWSAVANSSCLTNDYENTTWNRTQYDVNSCAGSTNTTYSVVNQTYTCNYCSYSVVNSSWSDWFNVTACLTDDTDKENRTMVTYDSNYSTCYGVTGIVSDLWNSGNNISYFENRSSDCNYCSYSVVNSSWTDWLNYTGCNVDFKIQQSRYKIEYDENYGVCYAVTGIWVDLWNIGENKTYFENQSAYCNFSLVQIGSTNLPGQVLEKASSFVEKNSYYISGGLVVALLVFFVLDKKKKIKNDKGVKFRR